MNTNTKPAAGAFASESGRKIACPLSPSPVQKPAASPKKEAGAVKPKGAPPSKTRKAAPRPLHSPRAAASAEKLVCRYCGSDDLAPSFKKRRDARCRACFKKRYGSAARKKGTTRPRKAKVPK